MALTKVCKDCKKEKSLDAFYTNGRQPTKRNGMKSTRKPFCKDCSKERNKKDRENIRNRNIRWKYGIEYSDLLDMYKSQDGKCAICNIDMDLFYQDGETKHTVCHVDHNHNTDIIRGLLCSECNTGLGKFKDNVDFLQSAIDYLEETINVD